VGAAEVKAANMLPAIVVMAILVGLGL
jgi:hypothetical protein